MLPAAAHGQSDIPTRALSSRLGASGDLPAIRQPRIVALDRDHQQQALAVLLELLAAVLNRPNAERPSSTSPIARWPRGLG
jgi:hypothetical protein